MSARLILVVEDNDIIVDLLRSALASWGYAFEVAEDGRSAVSLVREHGYDLVIMDIVLSNGVSGIDAARLIRALPEPKRSIPIIALTGGMATTTMAELEAAQFATVLHKPVLPDALRAAIEGCLGAPGP